MSDEEIGIEEAKALFNYFKFPVPVDDSKYKAKAVQDMAKELKKILAKVDKEIEQEGCLICGEPVK